MVYQSQQWYATRTGRTFNWPVRGRQVRLRLQWVNEEQRGRALRCEVALAGAALSVVGALQDELFNATLDQACSLSAYHRSARTSCSQPCRSSASHPLLLNSTHLFLQPSMCRYTA